MSTEQPQDVSKPALPSHSDRETALQRAMVLFQSQYGYNFTGTSSMPPDAIAPIKLSAADVESKIIDKDPEPVTKFLKKILANQNVPSWVHDKAEEDLLIGTKDIVFSPGDSTWKSKPLHKIYYPDDTSQSNSIQTDAIFFYINLSHTVHEKLVNESIVAYVGDKSITDDKLLAQALGPFTGKYFEDQFNYQWGQNPPDFTDDGTYLKANSEALGYFEDENTSGVESFVKDTLLSSFSIPEWTANAVVSDIIDQFTSIITSQIDGRSWPQVKINQPFHDQLGVHNSLYVNAAVVYYSYAKTLFNGGVVKISYVFWMGTIFEKLPLKTVIYTAMITQLFNNLRDSNKVDSNDLPSNEEGLQSLLSRCAFSKFKGTFGYDFKGSSTKAKDSNGDELYGVESFGRFDDVTDESVATWTKAQIFSVPALKSKFDEQTVFWLTKNASKTTDNNFGNDTFLRSYPHPLDSSKILNTKAAVFYANASQTESGFNVQTNLFYYMGIYYVANDAESDDDGV
ncbi:hypothetical protein GALMADRAFT_210663 [Galerina marginata CBS 339.88]|uniref:Uncharacterized protein n=1 Tax=Galerina marginata (strain CBS 339.88) TaxID=685588 RepID=A0A067TA84_GALM3|nr:hypothetical protein GALMADRAFT_210663 [Galerina marginata CBS 339.88]